MLIKSTAMSMPAYAMNVLGLPKMFRKEITSVILKFYGAMVRPSEIFTRLERRFL